MIFRLAFAIKSHSRNNCIYPRTVVTSVLTYRVKSCAEPHVVVSAFVNKKDGLVRKETAEIKFIFCNVPLFGGWPLREDPALACPFVIVYF